MNKKITWEHIYQDFKQRHPRLCKKVIHWCPRDFLTIELWMDDGTKMTYEYLYHEAKFIT